MEGWLKSQTSGGLEMEHVVTHQRSLHENDTEHVRQPAATFRGWKGFWRLPPNNSLHFICLTDVCMFALQLSEDEVCVCFLRRHRCSEHTAADDCEEFAFR